MVALEVAEVLDRLEALAASEAAEELVAGTEVRRREAACGGKEGGPAGGLAGGGSAGGAAGGGDGVAICAHGQKR